LESIRQSKATDTDEIHPNAGRIFDGQDGWGAICRGVWQPVFLADHQDADRQRTSPLRHSCGERNSSDLRHITKGPDHSHQRHFSDTMILLEVIHSCCDSIISPAYSPLRPLFWSGAAAGKVGRWLPSIAASSVSSALELHNWDSFLPTCSAS